MWLTFFPMALIQKLKKLGSLVITAESSVSEIEDIMRDGSAVSTFFLTTPGRVLHLFGSKLVRFPHVSEYSLMDTRPLSPPRCLVSITTIPLHFLRNTAKDLQLTKFFFVCGVHSDCDPLLLYFDRSELRHFKTGLIRSLPRFCHFDTIVACIYFSIKCLRVQLYVFLGRNDHGIV